MEYYIFNCYLKWLKDRKGNIFKCMSRLTWFANVLIVLLVCSLLAGIVLAILSYFHVIDDCYTIIPIAVEGIVGLTTYIYTSNYEISHSYTNFTQYHSYCEDLYQMLCDSNITDHDYLIEVISRINMQIEDMNDRIAMYYGRIHKFMELLIVPVSLCILSEMLNQNANSQAIIVNVIFVLLGVLITYAVLGIGVCVYVNLTIKKKLERYMQFKCDLQGVIDFKKCDNTVAKVLIE